MDLSIAIRVPLTSRRRFPDTVFRMDTSVPATRPRSERYLLCSVFPAIRTIFPHPPFPSAAKGIPPAVGTVSTNSVLIGHPRQEPQGVEHVFVIKLGIPN